jgi:hypothetical protein
MSQIEVNRIEAYSLLEFMQLVEKEILKGYRVSIDNDLYPQNFGSFYSCGLVKEEPQLVKLEESEVSVPEPVEQPKAKPARKVVAK